MAYASAESLSRPIDADSRGVLPLFSLGLVFLAALLLFTGGVLAITLVIGIAVLAVAVVQPRFALYEVLIVALVLDGQEGIPYLEAIGRAMKAPSHMGLPFKPLELIMLAGMLGLIVRLLFDDEVRLKLGELTLPICLFMFTIALGMGTGIAHGADGPMLRTETRGLFYLPMLYLIATHTLTERKHFHQMANIIVVCVNITAIHALYVYFNLMKGEYKLDAPYDLAFAHENAVFCAVGITILMARVVWSGNVFKEWGSILLMALPMAALLVMRRRAGIVALDTSLLLLCVVLLKDNLRLFLMVVPVAIVGVGLLLALTWNEPGGKGQAARSFRSITGIERDRLARDAASDDYRTLETVNVQINVKAEPTTGLGFGRPYYFYVPLADLSFWPAYRYIPHNTVFWVWMKGGVLAFVALLTLFGAAIFRASQLLNMMRSDSLKPLAFALASIVLMFAMFSYVDLGLVTARALIVFGATLGAIGAMGIYTRTPERATARSAQHGG